MLEGQHVMLSYNWDSQDIVRKIYHILKEENGPVWFNVDGDTKNDMYKRYVCKNDYSFLLRSTLAVLLRSLADGVENATVICCFMTSNYEKSENCKLELEYAQKRHKRIIPCMLTDTEDWKPSDWLEMITGGLVYVDFHDISEANIHSKARELISLISEQPPAPQYLPSQSIDESSYLFELIKHQYKRNGRIERLMNPAESYPIEESYINLAIIEIKGQEEKGKKLHGVKQSDAITDTVEEIYGIKTPISVKDIFRTCKDQSKKVLVFGRAGIGKSTFCRYVAHQWAISDIWPEYDLVILFPLHSLTESRYPLLPSGKTYSLLDVVKKEYFLDSLSEKDESLLRKKLDKTKVLWLFDGYNEIVHSLAPRLQNLLEQLLQTPHHIMTSRPFFNDLSYSVQMEITGFTDENIREYVKRFFNEFQENKNNSSSRGQECLSFLELNSRTCGIAYIPVNLELICSIWTDTDWSETKNMMMTALYDNMIEWLCRRYLTTPNKKIEYMTKNAVDACQHELKFLENLGFHGMKNNTIIIQQQLLEELQIEIQRSLDNHPQFLKIGVLKSMNDRSIGSHIQTENDYYFVHLSFQEYFAARYIVQLLSSSERRKAIDIIKSHKLKQHFASVFSYVSGLLAETTGEQSINTFWDIILDEPCDPVDLQYLQLLVSCFDEANCSHAIYKRDQVIELITNQIKCTSSMKESILWQKVESIMRPCTSLPDDPTIQETLIHLLETRDSHTKSNAISLINILKINKPDTQLISLLIDQLQDHRLRTSACEALMKIGKKAAQSEVIRQLVTALRHNDEKVRWGACEVLRKMGDKTGISDAISGLITALWDSNGKVRLGACEALATISEMAAQSEVIRQLVTALRHNDEKVRWGACEVFRKMGEKTGISDAINGLITALWDSKFNIRSTACQALAKIGEKQPTSDVIRQLVTALGGDNEKVSLCACHALRKIGEKRATGELISGLIMALGNNNGFVRWSACDALASIGKNEGRSEVISQLVIELQNNDGEVKLGACKVLAKITEKEAPNELVNILFIIVGDSNPRIRLIACEALGKIRGKERRSDVINQLIMVLGDSDSCVRSSACESICNIAQNEATSQVISQLVTALGNINGKIRSGACEALAKIGGKAAPSEVISQLVTALQHSDGEVRWGACKVLEKLDEKAARSDVINALLIVVGDSDSRVKSSACEVLGKIDGKERRSEVISRLFMALGDIDSHVQSSACEALAKIGEKEATSEMISQLIIALGNSSENIRSGAREALAKIGEKEATSEMISQLIIALQHSHYEVKWGACKVLAKIAEEEASNEIISGLVIALEDIEDIVSSAASQALGRIGGKKGRAEVTSRLVTALRHSNRKVSRKACEALFEIAEKGATSEVISGLVIAVGHSDWEVKVSACDALGKIGGGTASSKVINALLSAAKDSDYCVRSRAYRVLGKIGGKERRSEVISRLVIGLGDDEICARLNASEALCKIAAEKEATSEVICQLTTAQEHNDERVRLFARETLAKIEKKRNEQVK